MIRLEIVVDTLEELEKVKRSLLPACIYDSIEVYCMEDQKTRFYDYTFKEKD